LHPNVKQALGRPPLDSQKAAAGTPPALRKTSPTLAGEAKPYRKTVGSAHYRASVTQTELILAAALGSASLTAIASLGVVWFQEWRRGKASSHANLVQAIETVLGKSMAITQRAQVWSTLAKAYSGPGDGFAVLLRTRQPLNFQALFEPMIVDQEELSRAAARIWLESDQTIVALVNHVVLLANEVNSVVMPTPPTGWPARKLGIHVKRWDDADVEKVDQAMKKLGQARKALADGARAVLGKPGVDLFALPDDGR
jgi:hypothetical protein